MLAIIHFQAENATMMSPTYQRPAQCHHQIQSSIQQPWIPPATSTPLSEFVRSYISIMNLSTFRRKKCRQSEYAVL